MIRKQNATINVQGSLVKNTFIGMTCICKKSHNLTTEIDLSIMLFPLAMWDIHGHITQYLLYRENCYQQQQNQNYFLDDDNATVSNHISFLSQV